VLGYGEGVSPLSGNGSGERARPPLQKMFYYFTSKLSILVLYLSWICGKKKGSNCKDYLLLPHAGYACGQELMNGAILAASSIIG